MQIFSSDDGKWAPPDNTLPGVFDAAGCIKKLNGEHNRQRIIRQLLLPAWESSVIRHTLCHFGKCLS